MTYLTVIVLNMKFPRINYETYGVKLAYKRNSSALRYMENKAREWPLNGMFSESSYDMQKPIKRKTLSDSIMKNLFVKCLETKYQTINSYS